MNTDKPKPTLPPVEYTAKRLTDREQAIHARAKDCGITRAAAAQEIDAETAAAAAAAAAQAKNEATA